MKIEKRIANLAGLALTDEISAAQSVRKRLANAIACLDGHDTTTLIRLGSDVARTISTLDWRIRMMEIRHKQIIKILCDDVKDAENE